VAESVLHDCLKAGEKEERVAPEFCKERIRTHAHIWEQNIYSLAVEIIRRTAQVPHQNLTIH
jgi:hypothetical protein